MSLWNQGGGGPKKFGNHWFGRWTKSGKTNLQLRNCVIPPTALTLATFPQIHCPHRNVWVLSWQCLVLLFLFTGVGGQARAQVRPPLNGVRDLMRGVGEGWGPPLIPNFLIRSRRERQTYPPRAARSPDWLPSVFAYPNTSSQAFHFQEGLTREFPVFDETLIVTQLVKNPMIL
jgi:hypothetical protein